jgi:proteasome beta subunit
MNLFLLKWQDFTITLISLFLEDKYKPNMSEEEAVKLAIKSIKAAIERDIGSGGSGIDVAVINKNGFRMLSDAEIKNLMK